MSFVHGVDAHSFFSPTPTSSGSIVLPIICSGFTTEAASSAGSVALPVATTARKSPRGRECTGLRGLCPAQTPREQIGLAASRRWIGRRWWIASAKRQAFAQTRTQLEVAEANAEANDVVTDKKDLSEETDKRAVTLVPGLPAGR